MDAKKVNEKLYTYRGAGRLLNLHWTVIAHHVRKGHIKPIKRLVEITGITKDELLRFREQFKGYRPNQRRVQKAAVDEYLAGGITLKEVGKKHGMSESWASYQVKKYKNKA